jgi:glyoxylase-like metal-dependent hydrolase (beta-lactamase superfamily II)
MLIYLLYFWSWSTEMKIETFFDRNTGTMTYLVVDEVTKKCAVIDPVLNYNFSLGQYSYEQANDIITMIDNNKLQLEWILETHIHADHLTSAAYLKKRLGGKIALGAKVIDVLKYWQPIFNFDKSYLDGHQFDVLLDNKQTIKIGELECKIFYTPGHTPSCISYLINNAIFAGDTLFSPERGTARCDFPGGSKDGMYESLQRLLNLNDSYVIYVGHDYPQADNAPNYEASIATHKRKNIMVNDDISKSEFISKRQQRDDVLDVPKLLLPSLQVNLLAGKLGFTDNDGSNYIKIPLTKAND